MISSPVNEERDLRHIADNGFTKAEIIRAERFVIWYLPLSMIFSAFNEIQANLEHELRVSLKKLLRQSYLDSPKKRKQRTKTTSRPSKPWDHHYLAKLGGPDWSKSASINSSITKQQGSHFPISTMSTANSPREFSSRTTLSPSRKEVSDTAGSPLDNLAESGIPKRASEICKKVSSAIIGSFGKEKSLDC